MQEERRVRLEKTKYVAAGKHRVVLGKIMGGAKPSNLLRKRPWESFLNKAGRSIT